MVARLEELQGVCQRAAYAACSVTAEQHRPDRTRGGRCLRAREHVEALLLGLSLASNVSPAYTPRTHATPRGALLGLPYVQARNGPVLVIDKVRDATKGQVGNLLCAGEKQLWYEHRRHGGKRATAYPHPLRDAPGGEHPLAALHFRTALPS